jgi:GT2 family glycosyltransferase
MIPQNSINVEHHTFLNPLAPDVLISVVIVSWNTRDLLLECLESIAESSVGIACETFVVDNASTDDSVAAVRARFPQVRLMANAENVGFSRANNQAICQSTGRYVLLLNPDTKVLPGALETLARYLTEHPAVGAVGARILNSDGTLQSSCYPAPTLARELWRLLHLDALMPFGIYRMEDWDIRIPRKVDSLLGACIMARREALESAGLLDEDYFFTGEEIDLCRRLYRANWPIFWVPQAQIIHYGGQSSKLVAQSTFLRLYHGKILYFRKQHSAFAAALYKLVLFIATLARLLIAPIAWLERGTRREQHLTLARRYWQLLGALPGM